MLAGEAALFEMLMRRHNQRIYRSVRSVLSDEADVEDVMQQAYVNAFLHLRQFEQRAHVSTWLIRIALNEAFARRRSVQRTAARQGPPVPGEPPEAPMTTIVAPDADPERQPMHASWDAYPKRPSTRCRSTIAPYSCCVTSRD